MVSTWSALQLFGRRKDASEFPAEISLSPLVTEDGMFAITAVRDITDRRRLEEERRRLAQAEEAVKLRDEFISVASHELKTPLSTIQMQVETISRAADRFDGDEFKQRTIAKAEQLTRAVYRMSTLTDQLLDITRITGGRLSLEYQEVDLGQLIRGAVGHFEDELIRVASSFVLDLPPEELRATVDPLRYEQVVTNLLSNAIKYGPGKPIEVRVRADDVNVTLSVRDHGIGIALEHQSRVFDKFERVVSHRQYGGFGLGLWISRQLIEAHRGAIRVESHPGAGSIFTVVVPLRPPEHVQEADTSADRKPRVLIVDDDNDLRVTYADALRDEGVEIAVASNGQQALHELSKGPKLDLIFLDLMMPVMDGPTFRSEQLRHRELVDIPVVVMSAASDGEHQSSRRRP